MRKICGVKVDCFLFSSSQKDNRALKTIRSGRFIKSRVYEEAEFPVPGENCSEVICCPNCCFFSSGLLGGFLVVREV